MRDSIKRNAPLDRESTKEKGGSDTHNSGSLRPRCPYEPPKIVEDVCFSTFSMKCGPPYGGGCTTMPKTGYE